MKTGIIVCGLNGVGKSTLGKYLAKELNYHFIDVEKLYFVESDSDYPYVSPRDKSEVKKLLLDEINRRENFVFASVKGDYGNDVISYFNYAVLIDVPKEIRIRRVKNRSFMKFGNRILPGGDLYDREESFFDFVKSRDENIVNEWAASIGIPVIKIDGTKPVTENVDFIISRINSQI